MSTSIEPGIWDTPEPTLPRELRGLTPRSVPPELWDAPAMVASRRGGLIFLTIGFMTVLMGFVPITKTWGLYFLPMAYLSYIGLVIVIVSMGYLVRFWTTGGNLRYIEKAAAAMALIRQVDIAETELNGVKSYIPQFHVIYQDTPAGRSTEPVTREQLLSAPGITADKLAVSSLRFQKGDWVPVVWFPDKGDASATLYDTLGLNDTGIWTTEDDPMPTPWWLTLLIIVGVGFMFFCLIWSLWSMGAYSPIEAPSTLVIALSVAIGIAIAAVMTVLIVLQNRHEEKRAAAAVARSNEDSGLSEVAPGEETVPDGLYTKAFASLQGLVMLIALAAGAVMLPSLIVYELMVTANALLDDSEGEIEMAKIDEMIQVTHNGIFREFKIEYHLPGRGEQGQDLSLLSTPDHMNRFQFDTAVAIVKPGALGWAWVSEIIPVEAIEDGEAPGV